MLDRKLGHGAGKRRTDVTCRTRDEDTFSLHQWSNRGVVKWFLFSA
jgi:hypothetical protein